MKRWWDVLNAAPEAGQRKVKLCSLSAAAYQSQVFLISAEHAAHWFCVFYLFFLNRCSCAWLFHTPNFKYFWLAQKHSIPGCGSKHQTWAKALLFSTSVIIIHRGVEPALRRVKSVNVAASVLGAEPEAAGFCWLRVSLWLLSFISPAELELPSPRDAGAKLPPFQSFRPH